MAEKAYSKDDQIEWIEEDRTSKYPGRKQEVSHSPSEDGDRRGGGATKTYSAPYVFQEANSVKYPSNYDSSDPRAPINHLIPRE